MKNVRPKILCLGVSFPDIGKHAPAIEVTSGDESSSDNRRNTTTSAIDCVKRGILTQMDGRDLARCLATEERCNVDVYCVSQEKGATYRSDRHLDANFNRGSFVKKLQSHFEGCEFDQIILDYYWIPAGWDTSHWRDSFFDQTLINFATSNVMGKTPPRTKKLPYRQGIFLPFCFRCFKAIVANRAKLKTHFNISFLRKGDLSCLALWSGTQSIDDSTMQHILGKRIDQEEVYCTFGPRHIKEMESCTGDRENLTFLANSLEDFADIRFIVLEPLVSATPIRSARLRMRTTTTTGCFLGLVDPRSVQRGFRHLDTSISVVPMGSRQSTEANTKRKRAKKTVESSTSCGEHPARNAPYQLRSRSPTSISANLLKGDETFAPALAPRVLFG